MHRRILSLALMTALAAGALAGCAANPNYQAGPNATGGALVGGILGGVLGNQVGQGSGRTAAIIGGTLLGALIGGNVGAHMDAQDRANAAQALNTTPDGLATTWQNPNTGADYTVVPQRTYKVSSGQYCREYQTTVAVGGREQRAYGTACRQPDGSWKIVK